MTTSTAFQVFPTPNAFGPKRKEFKDLMLRDGKRIISQQFLQLQPDAKGKLKQGIIQGLFNVEICGIDLIDLNLKPCLMGIFNRLKKGCSVVQSVKRSIKQNVQGDYEN